MAAAVYGGPTPPDFWFCDDYYGQLPLAACQVALNEMSSATDPVIFESLWKHANWQNTTFDEFKWLPESWHSDNCYITLEGGGPTWRSLDNFPIVPSVIRGMASYIIDTCVRDGGGIGGYATLELSNTISYITNPQTNLNSPFPPTTTFFTIALTDQQHFYHSPGNFHPYSGSVLTQYIFSQWLNTPESDEKAYRYFAASSQQLSRSTLAMARGEKKAWYQSAGEDADED